MCMYVYKSACVHVYLHCKWVCMYACMHACIWTAHHGCISSCVMGLRFICCCRYWTACGFGNRKNGLHCAGWVRICSKLQCSIYSLAFLCVPPSPSKRSQGRRRRGFTERLRKWLHADSSDCGRGRRAICEVRLHTSTQIRACLIISHFETPQKKCGRCPGHFAGTQYKIDWFGEQCWTYERSPHGNLSYAMDPANV